MKRTLLKSKIHRATVTDANLHYQGSVTVDPLLMEATDLVPWERVEIYNCTNGERFATYAIPGTRGKGEIVINGAAAHKAGTGDIVILAEPLPVPNGTEVDISIPQIKDRRNIGRKKPSVVSETFGLIPADAVTMRAVLEEERYET